MNTFGFRLAYMEASYKTKEPAYCKLNIPPTSDLSIPTILIHGFSPFKLFHCSMSICTYSLSLNNI